MKCIYNICNNLRWHVLFELHPELRLRPTDPPFALHFSKQYKYVSCLISKNGCSSIVASSLKYDFGEEFSIEENDKIWRRYNLYKSHEFRILYDNNETLNIDCFNDYKKFIVLRHPFDRMISFINNTYKEKEYDYLFDKSLPPKKYVDSVLEFYPYMIDYTRIDRRYDKHAIPQRAYFEIYHKLFGDELEIVPIKILPEFYQKLTGLPLIKNNVTRNDEKVCTKETLTIRQRNLIMSYLEKYEFNIDDEYTRFFQ